MNETARSCHLAITPGEPAGIGPDITLKTAAKNPDLEIFAIADPELLKQRANLLELDIKLNIVESTPQPGDTLETGVLNVIPVKLNTPVQAGFLNPANSHYVMECLRLAGDYCTKKIFGAMITGPVHKGVINEAGFSFTGHTEFLAEISNSRPVMMLVTDNLRVALATTHLPLHEVSKAITQDSLEYIISTLHRFLQTHCAITKPVILVCGLNPHAGEGGHLGTEEIEIISPAIKTCTDNDINVLGPIPADTAFTKKYLTEADVVLAMYHDQGLPVLKYSGFGEAVNITLGLPYIRTSVDHGTALELAGKGNANEMSMLSAINMAQRLIAN